MAIPTGSGSEVLQRGWFENVSNTNIYAMFDGTVSTTTSSNAVPTNIIITVLNIICTNMSASDTELMNILVQYGGSTSVFQVRSQSIGPTETFVYSEKIILHPTDKLLFYTDSAATIDLSFNYIKQDWT